MLTIVDPREKEGAVKRDFIHSRDTDEGNGIRSQRDKEKLSITTFVQSCDEEDRILFQAVASAVVKTFPL